MLLPPFSISASKVSSSPAYSPPASPTHADSLHHMITGGMVEFRRSLASSFLFRVFVHVASQLEADQPGFQAIFPPTFKSAAVPFHRPPVQGLQYYSKVPGEAVVGQPTRHMAADLQVTSKPPPPSSLAAFGLCLPLSSFLPFACACICPCLLPVLMPVLLLAFCLGFCLSASWAVACYFLSNRHHSASYRHHSASH